MAESQATPTETPAGATPGATQDSFWNGDPSKLPAEVQPIYKNLQADYTKKSQEIADQRKQWEAREREYQTLQEQTKGFQTKQQEYEAWQRQWQPWVDAITNLHKTRQNDFNSLIDFITGRSPSPNGTQQQAATQSTRTSTTDLGDDDVVSGAMLKSEMARLQDKLKEIVESSTRPALEGGFRDFWSQLEKYLTLYDQTNNLRLQHYYGLTPKDGAKFETTDFLKFAAEKGMNNLNDAYLLKYGLAEAQKALEAKTADVDERIKQAREEAYKAGKADALQEQTNRDVTAINVSTPPNFLSSKQDKSRPTSFKDISNQLRSSLVEKGIR